MKYIALGLIAGVVVSALGVKAGNVVEDVITKNADSFTRWDALFQKYGSDQWMILKAIGMNESKLGDETSVARGLEVPSDVEGSKSSDGLSWGLMQITLNTGSDFDPDVSPVLLNNPEYSIQMAARLVRQLSREFQGELEYIVKAYNQGAGNTRKEIAGLIDGNAQDYWERFTRNYKIVVDNQGEKNVG